MRLATRDSSRSGRRSTEPVAAGDLRELPGEQRIAGGTGDDPGEVGIRKRRPVGGIERQGGDRLGGQAGEVDPRERLGGDGAGPGRRSASSEQDPRPPARRRGRR